MLYIPLTRRRPLHADVNLVLYAIVRIQPLETRVCDTVDKDVIAIRMEDAQKMGVAGFLTEWGAYDNETVPGSKPYADGLEITVS